MASGFGIFDACRRTWRRDAIDALGLGHLQWPDIVPYHHARGSYRWGAKRLPVFASVGDQQCALLGALLQAGELSINVATGSQVSHVRERFHPGEYQVRPFFDGRFLNTIPHLPAGRALNALVALLDEFGRSRRLPLRDPWRYVERAAARTESADLRVDLNVFAGRHLNGGGIFNLRESNLTVGHLFRAAFEHMADNYHAAAMKLDRDAAWKRLVFSGGVVSRSTLLQGLIKKKFSLPARLSSTQETLCGLLVLSLTLSGQAKTVVEAMALLRTSAPRSRLDF
jgi:sugar (pentulose or hexulose) kinase